MPTPMMPEFNAPQFPVAQVIQGFQQKAVLEAQQQQQRDQTEFQRVKMISDAMLNATTTMVKVHAQHQAESAANNLATLMAQGSNPEMTNAAPVSATTFSNVPKGHEGPVNRTSMLAQQMTQDANGNMAPSQVPTGRALSQTPDYQVAKQRLLAKLAPKEYTDALISQQFPKAPTTLEQLYLNGLKTGNQGTMDAATQGKEQMRGTANAQKVAATAELTDPKSQTSQLMRTEVSKQMGRTLPDSMSAAQLKPISDAIAKGDLAQARQYMAMAVGARTELSSIQSGPGGVEQGKVGQGLHLKALIDQSTDTQGNINLKNIPFKELALGTARLLSPTGQVGVELQKELTQDTARGNWGKLYTYFTGDVSGAASNATPQAIAKMYADIIDRQSAQAEQNRNDIYTNAQTIMGKEPDTSHLMSYTNRKQINSSSKNTPVSKTKVDNDPLGIRK